VLSLRALVFASWIAADPKSLELLHQAARVSDSACTVLLRGESGTGKKLLARILHYLGNQSDAPFVQVDCASLPSALLEADLFGQEGGPELSTRGRFELAGRGSIVFNEIAALSMPIQAKLLRVIEEKRFQRLGGTRAVEVEARIIALTSVDLERAVARRSFREDLYYRLNVVPLVVPALRERPRDVRPLAKHLLAQLAEIHRKPHLSFSPDALAALERYSFPGNVRELRDMIERAVILSASADIGLDGLPAHLRVHANSADGHPKSLEELERAHIAHTLDFTRGKKTKAAAILGISRKTLLEKRKRYGLA
jgi:two-component system response regulator AtoC